MPKLKGTKTRRQPMPNIPKYLTPEGLEKLKKELNYLKTVKRKEIAERLKLTASFGDLTENFAYQQTKEDQAFLEGRILELQDLIKSAKIIEKKRTGRVEIGSIVLVSLNNQKPRTRTSSVRGRERFQIVGPEEANPSENKISFQSPLGKALLEKLAGDVVKIETPEGKIQYKILAIE